jgi:hypothetical protein
MAPRGALVLIDTMAIKAAHETACWNAVRKAYQLHTVETCLHEATQTDKYHRQLVAKEASALRAEFHHVHAVTDAQRAHASILIGSRVDLHAGERDLLAHALTLGRQVWWLCGPDRATLIALHRLQLLDRMVALETLARGAGQKLRNLENQFTETWLSGKRTKLLLGEELL